MNNNAGKFIPLPMCKPCMRCDGNKERAYNQSCSVHEIFQLQRKNPDFTIYDEFVEDNKCHEAQKTINSIRKSLDIRKKRITRANSSLKNIMQSRGIEPQTILYKTEGMVLPYEESRDLGGGSEADRAAIKQVFIPPNNTEQLSEKKEKKGLFSKLIRKTREVAACL